MGETRQQIGGAGMNALARIGTLLALGMAPAFADNATDPAEDTGLQKIVVTAQRRKAPAMFRQMIAKRCALEAPLVANEPAV
jgi:hypothetical protein